MTKTLKRERESGLFYSQQANSINVTKSGDENDPDPDEFFHPTQFDVPYDVNSSKEETTPIDTKDFDEIVANVMNYIVLMNISNQVSLSTVEKVMEKCFPVELGATLSQKKKLLPSIIEKVRENCQHLYGMDVLSDSHVKEVKRAESLVKKFVKKESQSLMTKDRFYLFFYGMDQEDHNEKMKAVAEKMSQAERERRAILMLMLGNILLEKCVMLEEKLAKILKKHYGVHRKQDGQSSDFELFEDLVRRFCQEGYLRRRVAEQKTADGKNTYELLLGRRTYLEIGIPNLMAFLGQAVGFELTKSEKKQLVGAMSVNK